MIDYFNGAKELKLPDEIRQVLKKNGICFIKDLIKETTDSLKSMLQKDYTVTTLTGISNQDVDKIYEDIIESIKSALHDNGYYLDEEMTEYLGISEELAHTPITDLELPIKTKNALMNDGILYLSNLLNLRKDDLSSIINIGPVSVQAIMACLEKKGLALRDEYKIILPLATSSKDCDTAAEKNVGETTQNKSEIQPLSYIDKINGQIDCLKKMNEDIKTRIQTLRELADIYKDLLAENSKLREEEKQLDDEIADLGKQLSDLQLDTSLSHAR